MREKTRRFLAVLLAAAMIVTNVDVTFAAGGVVSNEKTIVASGNLTTGFETVYTVTEETVFFMDEREGEITYYTEDGVHPRATYDEWENFIHVSGDAILGYYEVVEKGTGTFYIMTDQENGWKHIVRANPMKVDEIAETTMIWHTLNPYLQVELEKTGFDCKTIFMSFEQIQEGGTDIDWIIDNLQLDKVGSRYVTYRTPNEDNPYVVIPAGWLEVKSINSGWSLTSDGTLTVDGIGAMADYQQDDANRPWHEWIGEVKSVEIGGGITHVGNYAFYRGVNVESVSLPEGLLSIGGGAFGVCEKLSGISLPEGLTEIGFSAFDLCRTLNGVVLPESLSVLGSGAFSRTGLTGIRIPANVQMVINWYGEPENAFQDSPITSIEVAEGNEAYAAADGILYTKDGKTLVCYPFGRENGESFTVPEGVTAIAAGAFQKHEELKEVILPQTLTVIYGAAFNNCHGLTEVTIPGNVKTIGGGAFHSASGLKTVRLPRGLESIGGQAFYCSALTDLYYEGTEEEWALVDVDESNAETLANVTMHFGPAILASGNFGENIYWKVTEDERLTVYGTGDMPDLMRDEDHAPWYSWKDKIKSVVIEEGITSVGSKNFMGYRGIESVSLPAGLKVIRPEAFIGNSMKSMIFPESLTEIDEFAFCGCRELKEVTFPDGLETIKTTAFVNNALQSVILPKNLKAMTARDGVSVANPFGGSPVAEIKVAEGNDMFIVQDGVLYNADGTILICYPYLEEEGSVAIPEGVKELASEAFWYQTNLKEVSLPETLERLGDLSFAGCEELTEVTVPKNVKSLGMGVFEYAQSLTTVRLPRGLESIGGQAFYCSALTDLYYEGTEEEWALVTVHESNAETLANVTMHFGEPIKEAAVIQSVAAAFSGVLQLNFYCKMPDYLLEDADAYVTLTKGERQKTLLVKDASSLQGDASVRKFSYELVAKEMRDEVVFRVYDGEGNEIPLHSAKGMDYSKTGCPMSVIGYCELVEANSTDEKMIALAKAAKDYGTAVQIYFGYNGEGLSVSEDVTNLSEAVIIENYAPIKSGTAPPELIGQSLSIAFDGDCSLNVYYTFKSGVGAGRFSYGLDGVKKSIKKTSAGNYLKVKSVPAKNLDVSHVFEIKGPGNCQTLEISALTYAYLLCINGGEKEVNLGKAFYLYNQAAKGYFIK